MNRLDNDLTVQGTIAAQTIDYPAESIVNGDISATADIDASKLEHQRRVMVCQPWTAGATSSTSVVHIVHGSAATVKHVSGLVKTIVTTASNAVTATVYKCAAGATASNSIAALTLGATNATNGTITTVALSTSYVSLVAGDYLVASLNAPTTDEPKGVSFYVDLYEDAEP